MPVVDKLIRLTMTVAVLALASVSFAVSYRHCFELALRLGEDKGTARIVPLTVDLLLVSSALTGLFCSRYGLPQPRLARFALLLGIGATVTVNVASGLAHGIWAAAFDGWPAVALVISSELLLWVIAAGRSLESRTIVAVVGPDRADREQLARVTELLMTEPKISSAEVGRRLQIRYDVALQLVKEAKSFVATSP